MNQELYKELVQTIGSDNVLVNEGMHMHTTFRVGGPADLFLSPGSSEEVAACIRLCEENHMDWYLIGNGSNLLVSDAGVRGAVIRLGKNFSQVTVNGSAIYAQAGAMLSAIARYAADAGLTGFEFAAGIPGTIGGAAVMNAGAYGGELKDVVTFVRVLTPAGDILDVPAGDMAFGYRTSRVVEENWIVLGVSLQLEKGDVQLINEKMAQLREQRISKQPLDKPSAGSTFKRPEGYFAGKLIMDAGFAGFHVGGACVSAKHCGFVVNDKDATAAEVLELIRQVQAGVLEQFHVQLETEVKLLGEFE